MKTIITILSIFFSTTFFFAQNRAGYMGKKNMISVFTTSNVMFYNYVNNYLSEDEGLHYVYFEDDNTKKDKFQIFRIDYRLAYQRILSNRFAIGIEYAFEKVKLNSYAFTHYNYYSSPVYNANSFLVTTELFQKDKIAGTGFSVAVGLGPKFYSFNTKQNYRMDENTPINIDDVKSNLNFLAINAFFQMTYRHPITPFLSLDVGLRFHTGILLKKNFNNNFEESLLWSSGTINRQLGSMNAFNLVSFKTGFVFLL